MPRIARLKSEFTTYHIIVRGNERKDIFTDSGDKKRLLETLVKVKEKYNFHIYAYCLMDNHFHLIIYDNGNDISLIMKSLNISYVMYFNKKYKRVGHLFQDRYKSEIVDSDRYLLELSKYIHNNPVKANIVENARDYEWSSFRHYINMGYQYKFDFLSTSKILGIISNESSFAQKEYYEYVTNLEEDQNLTQKKGFISAETENIDYLTLINVAQERINTIATENNLTIEELINNKEYRNKAIIELRKNTALTLKEIGELLGGLSESRVSRILRGK
ncbi:MAG TPA: transposase [Syntrophomonadaceae bacterium]|nr:transposase [Syntrophomonadaceae bacterium]